MATGLKCSGGNSRAARSPASADHELERVIMGEVWGTGVVIRRQGQCSCTKSFCQTKHFI